MMAMWLVIIKIQVIDHTSLDKADLRCVAQQTATLTGTNSGTHTDRQQHSQGHATHDRDSNTQRDMLHMTEQPLMLEVTHTHDNTDDDDDDDDDDDIKNH